MVSRGGNTPVSYTHLIEESIDLNVYYSNDNGATWKSVMTKNHPSDIWHFHSVDFINSINGKEEWLVTTGDSGKDVRWYSSNNDGTSWRQIVGNFSDEEGAQKFRTLGVRLIAPETYIWSSDSNSENYVFACPRSNMNIYNLIKVQSLKMCIRDRCWIILSWAMGAPRRKCKDFLLMPKS